VRSIVGTPEYWISDAILNLRHAVELANNSDDAKFADLKATIFASWQAIKIAEDLGAEMLKPLADYIAEEPRCSLTC